MYRNKKKKNLNSLINKAAKETDSIYFILQSLLKVIFPHIRPKDFQFKRSNNDLILLRTSINAKEELFYALFNRLILAYIPMQTVLNKHHKKLSAAQRLQISLSKTFTHCLKTLGLDKNGANRKCVKEQLIRLLVSEKRPAYKIVSKRFDAKIKKYIFTIESKENIRFSRTVEELSKDKNLLSKIDMQDVYDIGYTQGAESIIKENTFLLLTKQNKKNI